MLWNFHVQFLSNRETQRAELLCLPRCNACVKFCSDRASQFRCSLVLVLFSKRMQFINVTLQGCLESCTQEALADWCNCVDPKKPKLKTGPNMKHCKLEKSRRTISCCNVHTLYKELCRSVPGKISWQSSSSR